MVDPVTLENKIPFRDVQMIFPELANLKRLSRSKASEVRAIYHKICNLIKFLKILGPITFFGTKVEKPGHSGCEEEGHGISL